jgi:hypothetical protein
MRKIVIRSLRVALVLAILCASLNLVLFKSVWFLLVLLPSLLLFDSADSMLVWRLKRITDSKARITLIRAYLIAALFSTFFCLYTIASNANPIVESPYTITLIMYYGLASIFSFRYLIIVVRVATRFRDRDKWLLLAVGSSC